MQVVGTREEALRAVGERVPPDGRQRSNSLLDAERGGQPREEQAARPQDAEALGNARLEVGGARREVQHRDRQHDVERRVGEGQRCHFAAHAQPVRTRDGPVQADRAVSVRFQPTQVATASAADIENPRTPRNPPFQELIDQIDVRSAQRVKSRHVRIVGICRIDPEVCRRDTVSSMKTRMNRQFEFWHTGRLRTDAMQMIHYTDPFRSIMRDLFQNGDEFRSGEWNPALDIAETKDAYTVSLELPGVDPKDVEISVENDILEIKGEKTVEHTDQDEERKWYRTERCHGSFLRQVRVPKDVDANAIEATSDHGVLHVRLPRREEAKPKKIEVRVN